MGPRNGHHEHLELSSLLPSDASPLAKTFARHTLRGLFLSVREAGMKPTPA